MHKKEIEKTVKLMVADLNGPIGRIPIERVLRKHIAFIEELRDLGATWLQISSLMGKYGFTTNAGETLQASQLRATISRIKKTMKPQAQATIRSTSIETTLSRPLPDKKTVRDKTKENTASRTKITQMMDQALKARK